MGVYRSYTQGTFLDYLKQQVEEHGGQPFQLNIASQAPIVYISDPDSIEHVLKTKFNIYTRGSLQIDAMHDLLGDVRAPDNA